MPDLLRRMPRGAAADIEEGRGHCPLLEGELVSDVREEAATSVPVLELRNLVKEFGTGRSLGSSKLRIRAVSGVNLHVAEGEVLAVVGESGCGKTTLMRLALGLEVADEGAVLYSGAELTYMRRQGKKSGQQFAQAVFQNPWASLNPRMRVESIVAEPLRALQIGPRSVRRQRVIESLELVGLDDEAMRRYPHEFSGGQRQRIALARALVTKPRLIMLDEPVSSLDVSIRAQIINLLRDIRDQLGTAMLMVSHDLATVRYISDRVAVMYLGRIVEMGPAEAVFSDPAHPYTQLLLETSKRALGWSDPDLEKALATEMPSPANPPSGCRFRTRCPHVMAECSDEPPPTFTLLSERHKVACHLY